MINVNKKSSEQEILLEAFDSLDYYSQCYGSAKNKRFTDKLTADMVIAASRSKLSKDEQRDIWRFSEYISKVLQDRNYDFRSVCIVKDYINQILTNLDESPFPDFPF